MKRTSLCLVSSLLVVAPASSQDCNDNGVPDAQDIAQGTSLDCNSNGVPDECDVGDLVLYLDFDGSQLPAGITSISGLATSAYSSLEK